MFKKTNAGRGSGRNLGNRPTYGCDMSSSKFSIYNPMTLLGISTFFAIVVIAIFVYTSPLVLIRHDLVMQIDPLEASRPGLHKEREQSRADFHEEFGYWGHSHQTLYASFVLPPIIGFALAMALRRHIRNLLLRNQAYFQKEMRRRLTRWDGIGLKGLREEISIIPQFLPLFAVIIFLIVSDSLIFPIMSTSALAFLATCGFTSYSTWKRIFKDAMRLESTD